jgi:hypothetical protein
MLVTDQDIKAVLGDRDEDEIIRVLAWEPTLGLEKAARFGPPIVQPRRQTKVRPG